MIELCKSLQNLLNQEIIIINTIGLLNLKTEL